jgi:hypothetical protein
VLGGVKGASRRCAAALRAALDTPCAPAGFGSYEGTAKNEKAIKTHGSVSRGADRHPPLSPLLLAAGHVLISAADGLLASSSVCRDGQLLRVLADHYVTGVTIVIAAVCELTRLKDVLPAQVPLPPRFLFGAVGWGFG